MSVFVVVCNVFFIRRYVMTDCSPHILSWWKTNELLKEFIDRGYLDIALFDVYNPSDLLCVYSGQTLSANTLHIPPFLILNSVLSCLKQDVLAVRPTGFAPAVISLLSTQYEYFPSDPLILRNLQFFPDSPFTSRLKWSFPREFDSAWDLGYDRIPAKLLSDHFADYIGTTIVVPITAVSLLSRVLCWSAGKALILAGDRGVIHRDEVLAAKEPFVSFGADVRIPVNFDLLSLLAREPVQHALRGLVSLRRQRQPRARAPHRQQHRVVLHAHQRHLQRHALELEGHAEIARLACASASNQAKTGRFEIEFRVVGDPGQRIALERLARGREAALAVDPVRGVEVEALLLRLRRQILEVFGLHDETLEGDRDVAKELEMDGERVGLQIFGMQGFLGDGIAIIIFMAFGDGEFGRIDSR